jgi:nicotinamidase-related amidase
MDLQKTAVILVGYQNDYFAKDGILRGVVEEENRVDKVLDNTLELLRALAPTQATIISTPIILTPDYRALASPVGILNTIKESGAFRSGTPGAEDIPELRAFGDRVLYVSGKSGFNAFSNTELDRVLKERGITSVLLAGMVTALCIDSTGRAAYERGYTVTILSDCTSARTHAEQDFYCSQIFPLYGSVATNQQILEHIQQPA